LPVLATAVGKLIRNDLLSHGSALLPPSQERISKLPVEALGQTRDSPDEEMLLQYFISSLVCMFRARIWKHALKRDLLGEPSTLRTAIVTSHAPGFGWLNVAGAPT